LLERQANKRKDRNHKIARRIVEDHQTVYYADDHFRGMAGKFGKSVSEAGLGQLLGHITYKGRIAGREIIPVDSRFTTMTCSACGAITGPKGWDGLAVRRWTCSACGAVHDRDVNAACVVLNAGARSALKPSGDRGNGQEPMRARETEEHELIDCRVFSGTHAREGDRISREQYREWREKVEAERRAA
jgi:transposase